MQLLKTPLLLLFFAFLSLALLPGAAAVEFMTDDEMLKYFEEALQEWVNNPICPNHLLHTEPTEYPETPSGLLWRKH